MKISHRLVLLFLMTTLSGIVRADIARVEPLFWWTDMASEDLQLMIYGEDIGLSEVSVDYEGVRIAKSHKTDNPNYLFVDLIINKNASPGTMDLVFKRSGEEPLVYSYRINKREKGSADRKSYAPEDVIYLITPDRFANGDSENDTVESQKEGLNREYKGGRHGGDIQGVIDHLDYIEQMGFTQIWLMPVLENAMEKYSYHGYSTTDYYQIDPRFGTNALYKTLSDEAGKRGIGLIMDVILNHIGSEHWWMKDKPTSDWINNGGVFTPTSHRREALHDPHATQQDIDGFSKGWFVPTMPDLNQDNPFLAQYLIQNAIWWVEFANLSGIRVDTYSYSSMAFLTEWTRRLTEEYPNLNIVGEEWSVNPAITAFWQRGTKRHSDYESHLPSVMDFPLQARLVSALKAEETWATGFRELYETIATDFLYGDPYNLVVFADNHDMSRIASQLDDDNELIKMAMSVILTVRGIPQVFYGAELNMNNPGTDDHGIIRTDFPGGWEGDIVNGFSGQGLTEAQASMQSFFKTLLNWRKTSDAIAKGKMTQFGPVEGTYGYLRHTDTNKVLVLLNKNPSPKSFAVDRLKGYLSNSKRAQDVISGQVYSLETDIVIPARTALILEMK